VTQKDDNPVASGLVALVAVAVAIGVLGGLVALVGVRMTGLGGGGSSGGGDGVVAGETLYLPSPDPAQLESALVARLASPTPDEGPVGEQVPSPRPSPSPVTRIVLSGGPSSVSAGERMTLSGTYRGGEGAVLEVWSNPGGAGWSQFAAVQANVAGGVFQTWVQTFRTGEIKWKMVDPDTGLESNVIIVRHGS